jgi:hypothetical protein
MNPGLSPQFGVETFPDGQLSLSSTGLAVADSLKAPEFLAFRAESAKG